MKHFKISFILLFCFCLSIQAQTGNTLTQARTDYRNKEYAKALPVFERELANKPNDASLNLWYGVSLVETGGDLRKAEQSLLIASQKKLQDSYLYLGDIYVDEYRVSEARQFYDLYAKARPREKETTLGERYKKLDRMQVLISRTEDIQIIDSLVVDKSQFLSAYKLTPDAGSLSDASAMFDWSSPGESVIYTNGMGSKIYFGQPVEKRYTLSTMDKLLTGFGNEKPMDAGNFGLSGDINYPFVLMDGVTVYFAGKDENGMGGYDIYVTRYNLSNDSYLNPEILNMPFNSPANDYMMVVDENKGVGWFATDRFQPEGKVCIYTFIPNEVVTLVDTDDDRYKEGRARITSIKESWKKGVNYANLISTAKRETEKKQEERVDFTFIVDDNHTYHKYSDFKNATARNLYFDLVKKKKELDTLEEDLERMRTQYADASINVRENLSPQIMDSENVQSLLYKEILDMEKNIRNEEIGSLNR
ncbi:MAG TPA: hypothetical protein DIT04_11950 [Dysgonomonas sp.]|nr:hypothetical protein [Dysgonomonas sp.]